MRLEHHLVGGYVRYISPHIIIIIIIMARDVDLYDFSNYPKNHFLYSNINYKAIVKFKDKTCGVLIKEFVGLRPKIVNLLASKAV